MLLQNYHIYVYQYANTYMNKALISLVTDDQVWGGVVIRLLRLAATSKSSCALSEKSQSASL